MAMGSLATVGVLALVVVQGPKHFKAAATEPPVPQQQQQQQQPITTPPVTTPSPVMDATPVAKPVAEPAINATVQQSVEAVRGAKPAASATPQPTAAQVVTPAPAPVAQHEPPAPVQEPVPAPVARPAAEARELANLKDQLNSMAIRSGSVLATIQRLETAQARSGLGLRGDVRSTIGNFKLQMDSAEHLLNAGDVAGGRTHINMAERALERLEKFTDGR